MPRPFLSPPFLLFIFIFILNRAFCHLQQQRKQAAMYGLQQSKAFTMAFRTTGDHVEHFLMGNQGITSDGWEVFYESVAL
jgi:hypothetical protein